MTPLRILAILSAAVFIGSGIRCLALQAMLEDFRRFGLERLRRLTGALELAGGLGLLVGLRWTPVLIAASAGLASMMLVGFLVRLRVRDSVAQSLPSFALMGINACICYCAARLR